MSSILPDIYNWKKIDIVILADVIVDGFCTNITGQNPLEDFLQFCFFTKKFLSNCRFFSKKGYVFRCHFKPTWTKMVKYIYVSPPLLDFLPKTYQTKETRALYHGWVLRYFAAKVRVHTVLKNGLQYWRPLYLENITKGPFVSGRFVPTMFCPPGRFVPLDVLSRRSFCPRGVLSSVVMSAGDVLSLNVFSFQPFRFVPLDVLSLGGSFWVPGNCTWGNSLKEM